MTDRVYYTELGCYKAAEEAGRIFLGGSNYYDLSLLPSKTMREEFRRYLLHRGNQVSMNTILHEKSCYRQIVSVMGNAKRPPSSFLGWNEKRWVQMTKVWMLKNNIPFYETKISVYGNQNYREASVLRFIRRLVRFLLPEDTRPEQEKDIWRLEKLDIPIEENPIYKTNTLNFTKITQERIRQEVKQAVYLHLKYEKLGTVQREISSLRQFSKYLQDIHQMIGTRISDTLTLRKDCLSRQNGLDIIRIDQVKTRIYEKPISAELAALIKKAIAYTEEHYGETEYIFVDEKDASRPLSYSTVKHKVLRMILKEDLRDDNGNRFRFNTHMFRRSYGVKLTELHLDDWTIAKLLGHSGVGAVKHYRKMSNQLLADETRRAREIQTRILLANLEGWGDEYEQIRQDG